MKISVVIPAYNEEKYIDSCLDSLFKQTEPADEIIVVNNNSTDKTVAIAQKYPVKIIKEAKQGISYARNAGFNAAEHEIIARVDADTIVSNNWIKKIKTNFKDQKIDALTGTLIFYDLPIKTTLPNDFYLDFVKLIQKNKGTLVGFNMAIRKEMWNKIKHKVYLDNRKMHEDVDLGLWINKVGGKIKHDKNLIVQASARRILKNPRSFFIEYPLRFINTYLLKRK